MRLLADLDPHRLEAVLLDTIATLVDATPVRRVVVLVPTSRLARHVERRLAGRRDGWLGVAVLHLRAAARRIVERDEPAPPTLSSRLLDRVLGATLRRRRGSGRWPEIVTTRPGALLRLRATLTDLREAGVDPGVLRSVATDDDERELAEIHADYTAALEQLALDGLPDDAALTRRAVAGVADWLGAGAAVTLYGAYELNGMQLDLIRAIDAAAETIVFVPCSPGAVASQFAERWATTRLDAPREPAAASDTAGCGLPLEAMFDEPARPVPAPDGRIEVRHAQGEAAELRAALRDALAAVGDGCPPEEIAIIARSLAPYAAAVDAVVEETGVPVVSSVDGPLRRQPLVHDALTLLRAVGEGFPRRETVALLASPRIRWQALAKIDTRPAGDRAEHWSRGARIVGGLESWRQRLPEWLERRPAIDSAQRQQAATIIRCVEALDATLARDDARWSVHATRVSALFARAFGEPDAGEPARAMAALGELLDEMAMLDRVPGAGGVVPFDAARRWLDTAVDDVTIQRHDAEGGVRILDAMQARGMTFRRVALVGLNAGRFPQQGVEDPLCPDDLRRRLIEASGRPLPLAARRVDEERLLLALTIGSGAERLDVSWQRADESGRSRTPSLALRELARLKLGRPEPAALDDARAHHPSHPEQVLDRFLERPGLLLPDEAMLLDALRQRDVTQLDELGARFPELADGLRTLEATQSFVPSPASLAFDGRVGSGAERQPSVSALERLGACPLRYFFERVLGIDEPDDVPDTLSLPPRELGSAIHALLEQVYRELEREGAFGGDRDELERLGLAALDARRDEIFGDAGEPIRVHAPRLWEHLARRWHAALTEVVRDDLRRLHDGGYRPVEFEGPLDETLDLGHGISLPVRARLDRRMRAGERELISDYKTSRSLRDKVSPTESLRARRLQVALYATLVGPDATVELIGVHPEPKEAERFRAFGGFDERQAEGFRHTLRVLVGLERSGLFPLVADRHCEWCPFTGACRRQHPPTLHREAHAADAAPFRALRTKTLKRPLPAEDDGSAS